LYQTVTLSLWLSSREALEILSQFAHLLTVSIVVLATNDQPTMFLHAR
jgi:hypothetical protein